MAGYRDKAYARYEQMLGKTQGRGPGDTRRNFALFRRNIAPHLPEDRDAAILDIGTGFGDLLVFLKEGGYRNAQGVELSPGIAGIARSRGLKVATGGAIDFLRSAEPMDCIILYDVLEHQSKDEGLELMEQVAASLRPGGRALIVVPNMGNPFTAARGRYADLTHETGYTEESLSFLLELGGFASVEIRSIDHFVLRNPLYNLAGRAAASVLHSFLRLVYLLHGVTSTTLYGKNMLAVARKG